MANIAGRIDEAKTRCEGKVSSVKASRRRKPQAIKKGEKIYGDAVAAYAAVITDIQAHLDILSLSNPDNLRNLLQNASDKDAKFCQWADAELGIKESSSIDLADLVRALLEFLRNEDKEMARRLKADLEKCRLRHWSEIR